MNTYFIKYPLIALLCLLSACGKDDAGSARAFPEGSVGFNVNTVQTKGTPVLQLSELQEFKVLAYQYNGSWSDPESAASASVFMDHVAVSKVQEGIWSYAPLRYWPATGNITFFGYAPAASTDGSSGGNGLSVTTPTDGSAPVITYTVPVTVEDQPDLMVSLTQNYDLNKSNASDRGVNMELSHALTCVGFKAHGEGEKIVRIKVSGVAGKGTLTLGGSAIEWDIDPSDSRSEFEAGVNEVRLDGNSSSVLNGDGYLMMIPQALTDDALVTVTVEGGKGTYEQTFGLNIPGHERWIAGQNVEYTFGVKPTGAIMLTPEQIILPAAKGVYSSFSVICPEEDPDALWTVSVPDGEWLYITDAIPAAGSTAGSYTYSGQGTTMLYVFSPTANTSTTTERLSSVSLEGGGQVIEVKQLYSNEVYEPETPHKGWAGSNIYWVPDASYPEGGYLTFDDIGITENEQCQGVYFMWGSLVALSPVGSTWNGGVWNGAGGQIIHIPNADPGTNGGWNPYANGGWGYIPRLGWRNASGDDISSNPNNTGTAVAIPQNLLQSYLYQNHNPNGNVGDICKYITDRGWAPGAHEGRKWRMPVNTEYSNTETDYDKIGTFANQPASDPFGKSRYAMGFRRKSGDGTPFFPAGGYRYSLLNGGIDTYQGYRPGESVSLWTSSPRVTSFGNYGDAFDYIGIAVNQKPTNIQGFPRNTGSPVRCVIE